MQRSDDDTFAGTVQEIRSTTTTTTTTTPRLALEANQWAMASMLALALWTAPLPALDGSNLVLAAPTPATEITTSNNNGIKKPEPPKLGVAPPKTASTTATTSTKPAPAAPKKLDKTASAPKKAESPPQPAAKVQLDAAKATASTASSKLSAAQSEASSLKSALSKASSASDAATKTATSTKAAYLDANDKLVKLKADSAKVPDATILSQQKKVGTSLTGSRRFLGMLEFDGLFVRES
jgi:outer membrane biosynthesis protein TonB